MGKGGPQTSTVYQSSLPQYAKPYYENLMSKAQAESTRPYQPYNGQRLTGMSDETTQGLDMASGFASSGLGAVQNAADTSQAVTQGALSYMGYQPGQITNSYTGAVGGPYQTGTFGANDIGWAGGQPVSGVNQLQVGEFDQAAMDKYMSPFMQAVVDKSKRDAAMNYGQEEAMRDADVAASGAFGGSRAAVQKQIARNSLLDRLTGIDTEGAQAAFENAQQQFERDRAASLAAQTGNQQAAMGILSGNRDALLKAQGMTEESRQFGYTAGEDAARAAAQMGMDAQKASEQFRQSGAQLGLQGLGLAQKGADQMVDIQSSWDSMMLDRIKAQLGVGQTGEEYQQKQLDMAYDDFINQRDAQRQNLQFYSSLLQGVPVSANQNVVTNQSSNPLAGVAGSLTGLQALYQLKNT